MRPCRHQTGRLWWQCMAGWPGGLVRAGWWDLLAAGCRVWPAAVAGWQRDRWCPVLATVRVADQHRRRRWRRRRRRRFVGCPTAARINFVLARACLCCFVDCKERSVVNLYPVSFFRVARFCVPHFQHCWRVFLFHAVFPTTARQHMTTCIPHTASILRICLLDPAVHSTAAPICVSTCQLVS